MIGTTRSTSLPLMQLLADFGLLICDKSINRSASKKESSEPGNIWNPTQTR
jgi:hypothetical protein